MKRKKGYLLIESIISISVVLIIISVLYYLLFSIYNIKVKLEDKVELQQQANEMKNYIQDIIGNSNGLFTSKSDNHVENNEDFINTTSIKCKYKNSSNMIKDKEISLKKELDKLFVNTLNDSGNSESGGYEIGDYIDNMYISVNNNGEIVKIKLELSKNSQNLITQFSVHIKNLKDREI